MASRYDFFHTRTKNIMEKMQNLLDLLNHEIEDLYSAEDQITSALPKMIEKARNAKLKQALTQHLRVTEEQIRRLDKIKELLNQNKEEERKGFLGGLFGGGGHKCRGMEGLIEEGEKIMGEDMDPDVMDAAIIASSQKIEHYEICGYGTARAFARELKLPQVERLLTETLNEEYESDDKLTSLAVVGGLNEEAKDRSKRRSSSGQGNASGARKASKTASKSSKGASKSSKSATKSSKGASKASKSATKSSKSASKTSKSASKSGRGVSKKSARPASRGGSSRSAGKTASKAGRSKAATKGGRSKAASKGGKKSASKSRR